ncbi:nucleic-acid-binding protein from transposon X-element [Caerostris extrusa]|uniref:Nucleic-acid-binding protein from transposon X-element n=1 Tax=Caerostris extrusa TaxID=172846 RepID=A0AAV4X386_CAEEX|nr:nucleic-acid-binding protein from transposon X-element [Caerostris extrusa]
MFRGITCVEINAVLKGLPKSTTTEEIKEELSEKGFTVEKIIEFHNLKTNVSIALWQIVRLEPMATKNFSITKLQYLSIKIEKYNRKPGPTQCFQCNFFHHSSANYHTAPRCLKCGSNYRTKDCHIKEKVEYPRCINCNELGHTAAWKGCSKYPKVKNTTNGNSTGTQTTFTSNKVNEKFSFANIVTRNNNNVIQNSVNPKTSSISPTLIQNLDEIIPHDIFKIIYILKEFINIFAGNNNTDHLFNQLQTANNPAGKLYLLLNGLANQPSMNNHV